MLVNTGFGMAEMASLPLNKKCQWNNTDIPTSIPTSIPDVYKLELSNLTNDIAIITLTKINNKTSGINTLIFPFPYDSWVSLNEDINVENYKWIMKQVEKTNETNTNIEISRIPLVAAVVIPPHIVRTFVGQIDNVYGYYIYNSLGNLEWPNKLTIYIWRIMFDRMPRIKMGNAYYMEYSFYNNARYCKIQYLKVKDII